MLSTMTAKKKVRRSICILTVSALGLAACAEAGGNAGGDVGGSVEYGASQAEYQEALADMSPVTLHLQSTAPKGAETGRRFEEYAATVEEWSGGKITFEIAFANAIAPPDQVDDALADGRIDVGSVIAALDPSKFPANNVLWDLSFIGSQRPVDGLLQWHGAMLEIAAETDEMYQEFEENGMKLLLPAFSSGSYFVACSDERSTKDALGGSTVASQSRVQNRQAEALGMSPATISYAEMFESLQRGVVKCALSTLTVAELGGFIPAAPYFAIDPEIGLASPGGAIAFGLPTWESLPLPARQLLFDRLDVLLEVNLSATWNNVRDGLNSIVDAGGKVTALDDEARAALASANEDTLREAATQAAIGDSENFAENVRSAEQAWAEAISEMGIDGIDVDYAGFVEWHAAGEPDLQPYFERLWQDVMISHRPA